MAGALLVAATLTATSACQGDWDEPDFNAAAPYGNNSITEDSIITIAQLKADYPNVFEDNDRNVQITRSIKIRGRVIGNDFGSNLYKQFAIQDSTGAMIIAVNQSGLNGFLAEGQDVIIDLKDLYIGGYRKQPEIGMPYNGTSIGRMNKDIFQQHFRLMGQPDVTKIDTLKNFDPSVDKNTYCGQLVRLENVSFAPVAGLGTFAPDTVYDKTVTLYGGCVNRVLNEYSESKLVIRTSTYAKFAAKKLPFDEVNKRALKCNLVGIATRYVSGSKDTWQILIRKESDIEVLED